VKQRKEVELSSRVESSNINRLPPPTMSEWKIYEDKLKRLLDCNRPKNLKDGVRSGVGNVVKGTVGGVAVAVICPIAGLIDGLLKGGSIGGLVGVTAGTVCGVMGGTALAVGGT